MKKIKATAILLALVLLAGVFPANVLAEDPAPAEPSSDYTVSGLLDYLLEHGEPNEWGTMYYADKSGSNNGLSLNRNGIGSTSGGSSALIGIDKLEDGKYRLWRSEKDAEFKEYYDVTINSSGIAETIYYFHDFEFGEDVEKTCHPAWRVWLNLWGGRFDDYLTYLIYPGKTMPKPADPTKDGYEFCGWYTDPDRTELFNFGSAVNANTELFALWKCKVNFDLNYEGHPANPASVKVKEGCTLEASGVSLPADPKRTGMDFIGWFENRECTVPFDPEKGIDSELTLYAGWAKGKVTLTFEGVSPYGTYPKTRTCGYGEMLVSLPSPTLTREGIDKNMTFNWWYYDAEYTKSVECGVYLTEDATIYAKWLEPVTVTFDTDYSHWSDEEPYTKTLKYGSRIAQPSDPGSSGADFGGWYLDEELTQRANFSTLTATEDMTLYAKWIPFCHVYYVNNIEGTTQSCVVSAGEKLTEPQEPVDIHNHKEFYGWYADGKDTPWDFSKDTAPDSGSLRLTARFGEPFYVIFDRGEGFDGYIVEGNKPGRLFSGIAPSIDPLPPGKVLAGWYLDKEGTRRFDLKTDLIPEPEEGSNALELYAVYGDSCEITVHVGYDEKSFTAAAGYPPGSSLLNDIGEELLDEDYKIYGWTTKENDVTTRRDPETDKAYNDLHLYALRGYDEKTLFEALEDQYFKLDEEGRETGFYMSSETFVSDDEKQRYKVKAVDIAGFDAESRAPIYRLYCSADKQTSGGSRYYDLIFTDLTPEKITLHASQGSSVYLPYCFVTLDYNGGRSAGGASTGHKYVLINDLLYGEEKPVRLGFDFECWCTDEACLEPFDETKELISGNTTLYARWNGEFTVMFESERRTLTPKPQKVRSGNKVTEPDISTDLLDFDRSDYYLENRGWCVEGWYTDGPKCTQRWDFNTPVYSGMTLYAKWKEAEYTADFEMNGHGGKAPASQTFKFLDRLTEPETPEDDHYDFAGWYEDSNFRYKWEFRYPCMDEDMTLYARWKPKTFKVSFEMNGHGEEIDDVSFTYGTAPKAPEDPSEEGFVFGGWFLDSDCTKAAEFSNNLDGDVTFYASWQQEPGDPQDEPDDPKDEPGDPQDEPGDPQDEPDDPQDEPDDPKDPKDPKEPKEPKEPEKPSGKGFVLGFTDVSENAWYAESVEYCAENGLMEGMSDTVFSPGTKTTRGQLVTILYRLEGEPAFMNDNLFSDVETGSWYEKAVVWAQGKNIVEGYGDGTFGPEDPLTREQAAAILWRYASCRGLTGENDEPNAAAAFSDFADVSEYAKPAVEWAVENGLLEGDGGKLRPKDAAKRDQIAAILMRFCENFLK